MSSRSFKMSRAAARRKLCFGASCLGGDASSTFLSVSCLLRSNWHTRLQRLCTVETLTAREKTESHDDESQSEQITLTHFTGMRWKLGLLRYFSYLSEMVAVTTLPACRTRTSSELDVDLISTWALTAPYFLAPAVTKSTLCSYLCVVTFHSPSFLKCTLEQTKIKLYLGKVFFKVHLLLSLSILSQ